MKIFAICNNYNTSFGEKKKHNSAKYIIPAAMMAMMPVNACKTDTSDMFVSEPIHKEVTVSNPISSSLGIPYDDYTINKALSGKTIVIDAGHGGKRKSGNIESGTVCTNPKSKETIYEMDITLAVSKEIKNYLKQTNAKIVMVRDSNHYVELHNRALDTRGDAYISIHADFCKQSKKPKGASIYIYKPMTDKAGKQITHKPLCHEDNNTLASSIINNMDEPYTTKIYEDCLKVLRLSDSIQVPSTLLELGFISNEDDVNKLTDTKSQEKMGKQIAGGITTYFIKKAENEEAKF